MKYFKLGTALQIFLVFLLISSGIFVGLFTYKMQVLQTVNYKQKSALKDLKNRYKGFTKEVVSLRKKLKDSSKDFGNKELDREIQLLKATELLSMLQKDIAKINIDTKLPEDKKLISIKNKLEKVIEEGKRRGTSLKDLDEIIDVLEQTLGAIYINNHKNNIKKFNTRITTEEPSKDRNPVFSKEILNYGLNTDSYQESRLLSSLYQAEQQSIEANKELKLLSYSLSLKKKENIFYDKVNETIHLETSKMLKDKINFIEKTMKKTGIGWLSKISKNNFEEESGGPLISYDENNSDLLIISEKISKFEILRKRFLSIPLSAPLKKYYVTSNYGVRKDPFSGRKAFHSGIDLGAAWGSKIKATSPGVVRFTGKNGSYGNAVFIDHGYGIQTRYAHLSEIYVNKGDKIKLGQSIAKIGNTGRSKGKHLHYEIKVNDKTKNPRPFLKEGRNVFKK